MSDIPTFWRQRKTLSRLLWPLSQLMAAIVYVRKEIIYRTCKQAKNPTPPILVIGNLSVGGNGKTPVVIALCKALSAQNIAVGVVSRGYGGSAKKSVEVRAKSDAQLVGDEALLIKQQCQVPVVVAKKRTHAVDYLRSHYPDTQLIISDDGLQHYRMARTLEWVVIARDIGLGNGWLLPAGPLREPPTRLRSVDKILLHGHGDFKQPAFVKTNKVVHLTQENKGFRLLSEPHGDYRPITHFTRYSQFCALTAIARPERFFATLTQLGIELAATKALPDHAHLAPQVVHFDADSYIIVTEKDAVKTQDWPASLKKRTMVLAHELVLPVTLLQSVTALIERENSTNSTALTQL